MIFYRVALFVLAFNLVLAFVNTIPLDTLGNSLDDPPFNIGADNEWNVTTRLEGGWNASSQNLGVSNLGFGDIPGGFIMFIGILGDSTVTMYFMLDSFGLPNSLSLIFTGLAYITYLAGGIQLWTGRNIER